MEAVRTPILEGITLEEQEQMRVCFGVREERFRAGETVYDFAEGRKYLGLIARGSAVIQRIDHQGGRTILEHLESGGVFGEMLMFKVTGCRTRERIILKQIGVIFHGFHNFRRIQSRRHIVGEVRYKIASHRIHDHRPFPNQAF